MLDIVSYYDLQPFVTRHPIGFFETRKARTFVNVIEARLVKSINEVYSKGGFIGTPLLSELISAVLTHDFDQGGNLEDIIIRKIERTVFAIEERYRRPTRNLGKLLKHFLIELN
ncbi:hypothetical protein RF11_06606 [Thelohanellus kitauei]|uniref:Uncharacterized protein n=1 Tax=Thelohanellus kitauei TaxID=669202 RepID=A0A0C2J6B4_THEKT|nr:hypothetical protein RF11_06606 [Thelohanellus kitauei]